MLAFLMMISVTAQAAEKSGALRLHSIFGSQMVIQRDKPILFWGWTEKGQKVSVQFGESKAQVTADKDGRWEAMFPAQQANAVGQTLTITGGQHMLELVDILIGDIWVMTGQSNMAFALSKTFRNDMERATAHLPLLRRIGMEPNESEKVEENIPAAKLKGWDICSPETAGRFSSIGYTFASRIQRATQIPIGIIDVARGGSCMESWVPKRKFAEHPIGAAYMERQDKLQAEFDWDAQIKPLLEKWEETCAEQRKKGVAEDALPPKPTTKDIRSWNVPARSPNAGASVYNGMFASFKGLEFKGALFHQGYNNSMMPTAAPKRYLALMPLMIQGWREDFNNEFPVGVIGLCAGGMLQEDDNFEQWSNSPGAYVREAQHLGIAELPNTGFIPAYDQRLAGLHTAKKFFLGTRAARWALKSVYAMRVEWDTAKLLRSQRDGERILLTFDKGLWPDDNGTIVGFSIAEKSGKFYKAKAQSVVTLYQGIWGNKHDRTKLHVWSPLVKEPVAVRYAWARSPMGNLKVNGKPWQPLHSFRTDNWDWSEPEEIGGSHSRQWRNELFAEAAARLAYREQKEAEMAVEILKQRDARIAVLKEEAPKAAKLKAERKAAAQAAQEAAAKEKK